MKEYKYNYTYLITNVINNKKYYGVHSGDLEPSIDLGIKYISSSTDKLFLEDQRENSSNYKYEVVSLFDNRLDAKLHEIELHDKYNVGINPEFYNKAKASLKGLGFDVSGTVLTEDHRFKISKSSKGHKKNEQTRTRMSKAQKGVPKSESHKLALSNSLDNRPRGEEHPMYGKTHTDEAKRKIGLSSKGRKHTDESRKKISEGISGEKNGNYEREFTKEHREKIGKSRLGVPPSNKGKKEVTIKCPHCEKEGGNNAMKRWHFTNCKKNTNI